MNRPNKHNLDIEVIIPMLVEGQPYRQIAKHFNCPLTTLYDFCQQSTSPDGITANSPRTRIKLALEISADSYADLGTQALPAAQDKPSSEVHRANYLAAHYRWLSSKRNPLIYGNNSEVDVKQTTKIIKVKTSETKEAEQKDS